MNNINIILLILILIIFIIVINKNNENFAQTQCQQQVYLDPHKINHCNSVCCNPYGNRYTDTFSIFFSS
jgi:hypothetical protein